MPILIVISLLIVGLVLVVRGADWLVDGASALAKKLHVPQIVIGLTVVAFGTSLPELVVSVSSALAGSPDMSIGNVMGSNIANILIILGIAGFLGKIMVPKNTLRREIPFLIGITLLLLIMTNDVILGLGGANMLTKVNSGILLLLFGGFLAYVFRLAKKSTKNDDKCERMCAVPKEQPKPMWLVILLIVMGLVALIAGGALAVHNAVILAEMWGMSEAMIGLTILAVGTSMPEIMTSIIATKRGETELAIGNIVGSNIFNILLILGAVGVIKPMSFNTQLNTDIMLSAGITIMLYIAAKNKKRQVSLVWSVVFLLAYVGYVVFLVKRG